MKKGTIAALLVVAILAGAGVGYFIGVNSTPPTSAGTSSKEAQSTTPVLLPVYEETCTTAYFSPNNGGGTVCAIQPNPVIMPMSFNLSQFFSSGGVTQSPVSLGEGSLQDVFFGVYLESGQAIRVSMNSTSPIILRVYLDNRTSFDAKDWLNESANYGHLLTNQTGVTTYGVRFLAQQSGLYTYELTVNQPNPVPKVSFDIQRS